MALGRNARLTVSAGDYALTVRKTTRFQFFSCDAGWTGVMAIRSTKIHCQAFVVVPVGTVRRLTALSVINYFLIHF
jgi:hypothetical protein